MADDANRIQQRFRANVQLQPDQAQHQTEQEPTARDARQVVVTKSGNSSATTTPTTTATTTTPTTTTAAAAAAAAGRGGGTDGTSSIVPISGTTSGSDSMNSPPPNLVVAAPKEAVTASSTPAPCMNAAQDQQDTPSMTTDNMSQHHSIAVGAAVAQGAGGEGEEGGTTTSAAEAATQTTQTTTAATNTTMPPPPPPPSPPRIPTISTGAEAESYEREHVHSVYESIATHFSATRYKPWPVIASFLLSLAPGSVGLDVGCGNGKYLAVNPDVHVVGSDRSASLVRIARDHGGVERGRDVAVADGLALPFRDGAADFAICVAVLHHLSTRERRREGVRALLDCVRKGTAAGAAGAGAGGKGNSEDGGGRILVYVWALEQGNSRRGWTEGADQEQLVPWVLRSKAKKTDDGGGDAATGGGGDGGDITYQRYYHLYRKGELEEDVEAVGGKVVDSGYDKDNWWVIASRADN